MKKVLAIILSVAMLFGALALNTFAEDTATTPKVTIITNEGSPDDAGTKTYFTVRFDNFDTIKGMEVFIKVDNGAVIETDSDATLDVVSVTGFDGIDAEEDANYTINNSKDTIKFVDLTAGSEGKIVVAATAPTETANIQVTGKYANSGTTLFEIATESGVFEVTKDVEPDGTVALTANTETTITLAENKFIPQGAVYKEDGNTYTYAEKVTDTTFKTETTGDYTYCSFDIPDNKITTFGASDKSANSSSLRFGNYSELNTEGAVHGTMVFEGDWLALKEYYIKKGYTVQQLLAAIYKNYDKVTDGNNYDYVYYKVTDKYGETKTVNVYKFQQKKYMWKNEDAKVLEYAIILSGVTSGNTYAAVAYSANGDTVTISDNVKSVVK